MTFNPLSYGTTGGTSAAAFALTSSGIMTSGTTNNPRVTGWLVTRYNDYGNWDYKAPTPRFPPCISFIGGTGVGFGFIEPDNGTYLQSVFTASRGVNFAGIVIGGVVDFSWGHINDNANEMTLLTFHFGPFFSIGRNTSGYLTVFGDKGRYTSTIKPPAGPMAFALWYATGVNPQGDVQIRCYGYPPESGSTFVTSGTTSSLMYLGTDQTSNLTFKGVIRSLYCWDKKRSGYGEFTTTDLENVASGLASEYNLQLPTSLVVVAGDSYGAGYRMNVGESPAQSIALQYPSYRVLNFARGGAYASGVYTKQLSHIVDINNLNGMSLSAPKAALIFDGHNETLARATAANPSVSGYTWLKNLYSTDLITSGYKVIWSDINPVSNRISADATIESMESIRQSYRDSITNSGLSTVTKLKYCTSISSLSPVDGTAAAVRAITSGNLPYNVPNIFLSAGQATYALTSYDEIHMGASGWELILPYIYEGIRSAFAPNNPFVGYPTVLRSLNVLNVLRF